MSNNLRIAKILIWGMTIATLALPLDLRHKFSLWTWEKARVIEQAQERARAIERGASAGQKIKNGNQGIYISIHMVCSDVIGNTAAGLRRGDKIGGIFVGFGSLGSNEYKERSTVTQKFILPHFGFFELVSIMESINP
jgi:hypothetical protein